MRYVGTGRILENVGQEKIKEDNVKALPADVIW